MPSHRHQVLKLYRQLLRLHQRLPDDSMATIGRQFVREEFHKHKNASPSYVTSFMREWTDYARVLERQLSGSVGNSDGMLGRNFVPADLNMMSDQQLGQLLELKTETAKPRGENNS